MSTPILQGAGFKTIGIELLAKLRHFLQHGSI